MWNGSAFVDLPEFVIYPARKEESEKRWSLESLEGLESIEGLKSIEGNH